jgi:hypothetical protein
LPRSTVSPHRLAWSRTPPFHGENRGSNPRGDARMMPAFRRVFSFEGSEGMRTPEGFDGASIASGDGHAEGVGQSPEAEGQTNPRLSAVLSTVGLAKVEGPAKADGDAKDDTRRQAGFFVYQ